MLTDEEKKALLKIARDSAAAGLRGEPGVRCMMETQWA